MGSKNIVQPNLSILNPEQIQQVHDYSLQILSTVGVRVDSKRARKLFAKAIGPKAIRKDVVKIPRELVKWALNVVPVTIDIYDRNGSMAFSLPDSARFGMGVTNLYFQEPQTDQVVPFERKHIGISTRLGHSLPGFDVISTAGVPQNVSPDVSDLYATLEMTVNTTKPIIILISNENVFPAVLDLLENLHGNLPERPFVIPYFNPITPLVMNTGTVDKMWTAIERGLPIIYSNYGMAGASTPITPAGTLALLNAELLAGLALGQLIREGTPMVLGSLPAYFDMKGSGSLYAPQSYLMDLACAEMMAHYRIPHAGTSGSGQGWGADLIAGGHQWMNHLISCIGKIGLAPFVGSLLGSLVFSPTVIVYANDIIQQTRLFAQGFTLDAESVGLDEVRQVGPGGNFLLSDLTLKEFRNAYYQSPIFGNLNLEKWQAKGNPAADSALRKYTMKLLAESRPPEDHSDLLEQGEAFIRRFVSK
jgi:trimethylamine--corrinoid protein Co-methyltransferase